MDLALRIILTFWKKIFTKKAQIEIMSFKLKNVHNKYLSAVWSCVPFLFKGLFSICFEEEMEFADN